jgi:hypothetical protein
MEYFMLEALSVEAYLLLSCLRQRPQDDGLPISIEEFVTMNSCVIEATCRVAEWLGLTRLDKVSVLGWAPTTMLVELFLRRKRKCNKSSRKQGSAALKEKAFQTIFQSALGDRAEQLSDCREQVKLFLGFLCLMEVADYGEWFPTPRLLDLAAESRQRDRHRESKFDCNCGAVVEVVPSLFERIEAIVNSRIA